MKFRYYLLIGIIVLSQGIIIGQIFYNPYPCTNSGIGCGSWWEMMQDTWANSYLLFSVLGGALIVLKGLTDMVHNDK